MKFGKVEHPEFIDFTLPQDSLYPKSILNNTNRLQALQVSVGYPKWNRNDLKNFYPNGIKEELSFYATQFNSIELNASFYRIFPTEQYNNWREMVPSSFKFFPKVVQNVSHLRRLNDMAYPALERFLEGTANFGTNLGTIFLQLHPNFGPRNWDRVVRLVEYWPKEFPLALEFRHADWFREITVANELYELLEEHNVANILVDTPGRRDLLHMRLTNNEAFIRFVCANHPSDYKRLSDWVARLKLWRNMGLTKIDFFIHQNMKKDSPLLASYFIKELNKNLESKLLIPKTII